MCEDYKAKSSFSWKHTFKSIHAYYIVTVKMWIKLHCFTFAVKRKKHSSRRVESVGNFKVRGREQSLTLGCTVATYFWFLLVNINLFSCTRQIKLQRGNAFIALQSKLRVHTAACRMKVPKEVYVSALELSTGVWQKKLAGFSVSVGPQLFAFP